MMEFSHIYLTVMAILSHNFQGVYLDENERKPDKKRKKEDSIIYKQVVTLVLY